MVESKPIMGKLMKFNKIIDNLANIDVNMEDEDKVLHLLSALPRSFENLEDTMLYGKEETITYGARFIVCMLAIFAGVLNCCT